MNTGLGTGGRRPGWRCLMAAGIVGLVLFSPPAFGQSGDLQALLDRLDRLERDIRTLNQHIARGTPLPRAAPPTPVARGQALARIHVRITALEDELRALTGREEGAAHQIDQLTQRLDKREVDIDFRLSAIERALAARPAAAQGGTPTTTAAPSPAAVTRAGPEGAATTDRPRQLGTISQADLDALRSGQPTEQAAASVGTPSPPVETTAAAVLPEGTSRQRYAFAFGLLSRARYDQAEAALRAFLDLHGDDPLAANARYWLGETYYVRGDFAQAARVFLEGFANDPKGGKAPDTLLKLGMALANLDKHREACAAFDKLGAEFPEAPASIQSALRRARLGSKCE